MKKFISLLLSIILIMVASVTTMADDSNLLNSSSSGYDSYVQNIVHSYLDVAIDVDKNDVIYLSQGFPISNSTSSIRIYFLFKNDICIGSIYVDYTGERYASTFYEYNISEVTNALKGNKGFAIANSGESLLFISSEKTAVIYGPESNSVIISRYDASNNLLEKLTLSPIKYTVNQENNSRVSDELFLDVKQIDNYTLNGVGLCWAACAASLGEYYTDIDLEAIDVYTGLQGIYGGTPVGSRDWLLRSAQYYGLTGNYETSGYSFATVRSFLRNDKPIYAAIRRIDNNNNTHAHAVVIDGYANVSGSTNYCYRMMDPNVDGHAWSEPISQSATASDFEYIYYNATTETIRDYTSWYNSMTII